MTPGGVVAGTAALLCCVLGLLSSAPAAHARRRAACCLSYHRKPLPFHLLKTYTEQHHWENCNLDAIIFETIKNKRVCTTRKDDWVREAVARLRKMKTSKDSPAKGGAMMKRRISSTDPGDRSILSGDKKFSDVSGSARNFSASNATATPTKAGAVSNHTEALY